jgi:hypothetical protein
MLLAHTKFSTLHSPTCPIGLRSDCSDSTRTPSRVQSDSVCSTGLYFEVYFPSGVRVESKWSPSGLIHSMLFKQFESHYSVVTSVRSDSTRIGLGLTTWMFKLVSENVKAWFWQALNPHPLHYSLDKPILQCSSQLSHMSGIFWLY